VTLPLSWQSKSAQYLSIINKLLADLEMHTWRQKQVYSTQQHQPRMVPEI